MLFRKRFQDIRRFTGSLRFKLSFYTGLVAFLTIVVFSYHSISTQESSLLNARLSGVLKDTEVIKAAIWNGMMTKDRHVVQEIVDAIGRQEAFEEINIYDRNGVLHYSSSGELKSQIGNVFAPTESAHLLRDIQGDTSVRYEYLRGQNDVTVVSPLLNSESCSSCHAHPAAHKTLGVLQVKLHLKGLRAELQENARQILFFALFLFVLISTVIGLGVIFLVSRPLENLRERARRISGGDYPTDTGATGSDSIAELSRSLDEMSRQIAQRERALAATSRRYKELFDTVPCYLTVISPDRRIVRANQAYVAEFGNRIGEECFSALKSRTAPCRNCLVEKTFSDGLTHRTDEVWQLPGGRQKARVVVQTAPIRDDQGNVKEVMEMAVDVTRLVKLQEEIRKKEEQFRKLFENVPCYLTVIDSSFRIGFYNQMFAQDFGPKWGEKCFRAYKNRSEKCDPCPVEKTFQDGNSHYSEEIWRRDGKEQHIVVRTSPITDESGNIIAVMEMCTNVTDLKVMENQLAILGETVAGTAHAVKNILAGLEGGVYIVDSGIRSRNEDRMQAGWIMVKKNVVKVSDLVKDILYAAKSRKPELRFVDPAQTLVEICDLFEEKAQAQAIQLLRDFPDSLGEALLDPAGIHTAISNLISNAMAACESNGSKHHITVSARVENSWLAIEVHDDGSGMSDDVKDNLFKKFYSTKGSKGTGLGLLVTRKIVEENGGSITFESGLGIGTTFIVRLPFQREVTSGTGEELPQSYRPIGETDAGFADAIKQEEEVS